jgi:cag pathogenicity island protein 24
MKYTRLTKEQLEELHQEFINFLATQSITGKEWAEIKENRPQVAEQELDVFSDLIWEGVLGKAKFLQNSSPQQLFLFKLGENEIHLIVVKVIDTAIDITTQPGFEWLQGHLNSDKVELFTASKAYSEDKNKDVFELIRQGAEINEGDLYDAFHKLL